MYNFSRPNMGVNIDNNKFIFNDVDLSNIVVIEKIQRSLFPLKSVRSISMPGADGEYVFGSSYGIRNISVDFRIVETTYEEALETKLYLASILGERLPKKLELKDFHDLDIYNLAILSSEISLEKNLDTLSGTLDFICHNPFNFSNIEKSQTINSTPSAVLNAGVSISPKITINVVTQINEYVNISTNDGQNLKLMGPFLAGSTVVFEDYTLKINGNLSNLKINLDESSFILLKRGSTNVSVTGQGSNVCTLSFKERYL